MTFVTPFFIGYIEFFEVLRIGEIAAFIHIINMFRRKLENIGIISCSGGGCHHGRCYRTVFYLLCLYCAVEKIFDLGVTGFHCFGTDGRNGRIRIKRQRIGSFCFYTENARKSACFRHDFIRKTVIGMISVGRLYGACGSHQRNNKNANKEFSKRPAFHKIKITPFFFIGFNGPCPFS